MLPDKFKEPAGFQWGAFTNAKGANIRYGSLAPEGEPKGTMIIVPGFRETIEKYFEVVREMNAKGFTVHVMDWRGQGGSDRFLKDSPQKMFSDGYGEHIETLHQFATSVIQKPAAPLILVAHSMGAHIGLRYLKEHEGVFDSAILTSPMMDIVTSPVPKVVARRMADFARIGNCAKKYVPGGSDWDEKRETQDSVKKTNDLVRGSVIKEIFKEKPELQAGAPTYGWIYHTFKSIDILNDEKYLKAIKTPLLMQISDDDVIVENKASERAARLLPNCTCVHISKAKHEIWMESDNVRNSWTAQVESFLKNRLGKQKPVSKNLKKNDPPPPKLS